MKIVSFLSHTALVAGAAFLLGLAFDLQALTLFGLTISASLLAIAARDYARPARHLAAVNSTSHAPKNSGRSRAKYTLPFAA